jgi:putative hydrolase of the HAD superfamily
VSIRAVLFDVDGTLYHQQPLRLLMAGELGTVPWIHQAPWHVPRLWRMLSAFRRVREELRALGLPEQPLARLQYDMAAAEAGVPAAAMEAAVEEWIYRRPLKYLPRVARRGMADVLASLAGRGLSVGVFSDYPVADKLQALGIGQAMTVALEATAPEVNAFKPHPRGLVLACERWGLAPSEVVYVGDRFDVDGESALRAGMRCVIVSSSAPPPGARGLCQLRDMRELPVAIQRFDEVPQ